MTTFTDAAWDGAASNYKDTAAYCAACLIDDNPSGQPKKQSLCHLPVKTPSGAYSRNAIRNALSRVNQVKSAGKAAARKRLAALAKQAGIGQDGKSKSK